MKGLKYRFEFFDSAVRDLIPEPDERPLDHHEEKFLEAVARGFLDHSRPPDLEVVDTDLILVLDLEELCKSVGIDYTHRSLSDWRSFIQGLERVSIVVPTGRESLVCHSRIISLIGYEGYDNGQVLLRLRLHYLYAQWLLQRQADGLSLQPTLPTERSKR